jgi:hypothetical protein
LIKYSSGLRVEDNFEYPHKSYCQNMLAILYSYDNKSCVRAKHIMINIEFMLLKENIQDQIISLEQTRIVDLLTKDLTPSAFREPHLTWVHGKVYDPWILKAQNKIRIYFRIEMCMIVVKSHST